MLSETKNLSFCLPENPERFFASHRMTKWRFFLEPVKPALLGDAEAMISK
jgi:hypothetical protein